MKRSSARLIGASVLVFGLALAQQQAAHAGNGKAALSLLPGDTAMVVSVNVDRAKNSAMFADAMAVAKNSPDVAKNIELLKAKAGFDVSKDLETLVMGFAEDFDKTEKGVVIVEGNFNAKKLVAFAKGQGAKPVKKAHRGVDYWQLDDSEIALIKKHLVVTPKGHMNKVIDVSKGKAKSAKRNASLMKMIKDADTTKDFWFAGLVPSSMSGQIKAQLGGNSIDGVSGSVDIRKGLDGKFRLVSSSAAGAKSMAGLMQMGLSQGKNDPTIKALGLSSALQNISIATKANNVDVGIKLSKAEIDTIKNLLKNFM